MPYNTLADLPPQVRDHLADDEQRQWLSVFNAVFAQTGDEEKSRMAAWGAVRKGRYAGRAMGLYEQNGLVIVRGWGMKFTGPDDPDLYDTHFSTLTALLAEFYQDAPLWYEHGYDIDYGVAPIGKRHQVEIYGFGVWSEHTLFQDHPLFARTRQEIERGELAYSSDSIAHYVEQGVNQANGELRAWPLAGWSLTKHPAAPGLGPVTLAGMEAVIQEVLAAPAKRIADGETVYTLTACKSVYSPPLDPTVAADPIRPDGPQAREAHGTDGFQTKLTPMEGRTMDPEMMAALAEFLGVEATPEAVRDALAQLITQLQDTEGEAAQAVNVPELRAALTLGDDGDVVERLSAMMSLLEEPALDYAALGRANRRFETVADQTPVRRSVPYRVRDEDDDEDDGDEAGRAGYRATPRRSRSLHTPNLNRGTARPGVGSAVMAALGLRPPGFRSTATMHQIRARLFQLDRAARAADSGDGPRGAWVLNREIAQDILAPLTARLVLFEAGAFQWPMDGIDQTTIRKMVGVPGAYWAAENTEVAGDDADWAVATLTLHELRAPTTWPNRWLRNLAAGAENMIRDEIVKAMRRKIEYSALFGDGSVPNDGVSTGQQPLGIRYTTGVTVTNVGATPNIDTLAAAPAALEDADVEETDTWGWISHPRTFRTFENMANQNGDPILRNTWAEGVRERTLLDYPYWKTTGVPKNLGGGSNESNLFFGDWSELAVGIGQDVELLVSQERYIEKNQTFVMGIAYVDTVAMYPEAFHVHTGVLG